MSITGKPPCDEAVIRSEPATAPCTPGNEGWLLAATILGSSMAFIDSTIVNVALPVLQKDLQATVVQAQWVVEAYALFLAALILVGGSLGDHFGRRRIYALGVALFAAASIWCGFAPDILQLILARAVQGIGGALLVPGSLAIISASIGEARRGKAIGTWSGFTSITAAVGPVLGGWLVQTFSWRWAFFINIPMAVIVLVLLFWRVPESRDISGARRLDWWGTLLAAFGLGILVYGLITAGEVGLGNPIVLVCLLLGVVILATFVYVEMRVPAPMLPMTLFRSRTFSGTNLLTFLLYAALGGALFFFPFNLVQVQQYTATAAGAALLPFILIMFLLSRWSGGLVPRYGARLPLTVGPLIVAAGFLLFARPGIGGSYWTTYFPAVVVLGLGMAVSVAPLTTAVMGSVDSQHAGIASGVNNASARAAGLLAVAVLGIVMLAVFSSSLNSRLDTIQLSQSQRASIEEQSGRLADISPPKGLDNVQAISVNLAVDDAFLAGFRVVMWVAAGLAVVSSLCAWLLVEDKRPSDAT